MLGTWRLSLWLCSRFGADFHAALATSGVRWSFLTAGAAIKLCTASLGRKPRRQSWLVLLVSYSR